MSLDPLLAIVGPTASGKSDVARSLSKKMPLLIVSCDSMQVYRGMPILTQAVRRVTPRRGPAVHLNECVPLSEEYNAARFRKDALKLIRRAALQNKIPCLVGGTGLYLRALLDGLFDAEEVSAQDLCFRKKMLTLHQKHGAPYLHERLKKIDDASAEKIHANDARRLIRALEVHHLTGKPMSEQKPKRQGIRSSYDCKLFFLDLDRAALYDRINRRVDQMLKDGLVEEVKKLRKKKASRTAAMALGFREIGDYLDGKTALKDAVEIIKKKTRNYAKRQISWFRHEKGITFVPVSGADTPECIADRILSLCPR